MKAIKVTLLITVFAAFVFLSWRAYEFQQRPEFCRLCHSVNVFYETWFHSAHKPVTNCQDCHIPQDIRKLYYEARYGLRDSYSYFIGRTPVFFRAKPPTPYIVRQNCRRCHGVLLTDVPTAEELDCLRCHRNTPHRMKVIK